MFDMAQSVKILCAYIISVIIGCAGITLLGIIVHLIKVAKVKGENCKTNFQVLFMIIITLIGIVSFFLSIVLIVLLLLQLILLDGHKLDPDTNDLQEFYYSSFEEIEYLIVIFDAFGHLSMLTVFVVRLRMCFANSIFGYSKKLIRFMYCCLIVLMSMSFVIIMEIINGQDPKTIIITEIIWELLIEAMCIWLLYLFVSKLHALVKMALGTSRRNLRATISYNISEKTRDRDITDRSRNSALRRLSRFSRASLDVDREKSLSRTRSKTKEKSPSPSPQPQTPTAPTSPNNNNRKKKKPSQTVLNNQNLVNVMTKMTLLVVIAVFGSVLSVIGNIYIEIQEIDNIEHHTADLSSMWAFLLPVIDMVLASFMLYLQFDFTKHVYAKLCTKMDIIFIGFCGDILDKEVTNEQMKVHREESERNSKLEASEKSKSEKSHNLQINPAGSPVPEMGKDTSFKRTTSLYSNGAEIPDIERAITPRPKDIFYGQNKLNVEHSADGNDNHLFRGTSPSPSPIVKEAIKQNDAVEIQIKPPRLSTVSQFDYKYSITSNKDINDIEVEEEHDEEEKQAILSGDDNEHERDRKTTVGSKGSFKLQIEDDVNTNDAAKVLRAARSSLRKLRINVLSRSADDIDDDNDGAITPMSPSPMSDPPPLTPTPDPNPNPNPNNNDNVDGKKKRKYWE